MERLAVFPHHTSPHPLLSTDYQCDSCLSSQGRGGSWLGCQVLLANGAVCWLPLVEAPGVADKIEDLTHRIFERIELSCTQAKAVNTMN